MVSILPVYNNKNINKLTLAVAKLFCVKAPCSAFATIKRETVRRGKPTFSKKAAFNLTGKYLAESLLIYNQ